MTEELVQGLQSLHQCQENKGDDHGDKNDPQRAPGSSLPTTTDMYISRCWKEPHEA